MIGRATRVNTIPAGARLSDHIGDLKDVSVTGALVVLDVALAVDSRHEAVLREAPELLARAIRDTPREERTDPGLLKERIRVELQRMFRKRVGRRPLVLPVVMEI